MLNFFTKSFEEQVKEIIKTGDLKLLQAVVGIRSPIALLQYCASFFITGISIAQARYQAFNTLDEVINHYKKPEVSIPTDVVREVKEKIRKQMEDNTSSLRNKIMLPQSSHGLKSLISYSCGSVESYVQTTDISSLCTINEEKVIEIYNNYITADRIRKIEVALNKIKEEGFDKTEYLEREAIVLGYSDERTYTNHTINECRELIRQIQYNTFLDEWYDNLLTAVVNEAREKKHHILHKEVKNYDKTSSVNSIVFTDDGTKIVKDLLSSLFNKEVVKRALDSLLSGVKSEKIKKEIIEHLMCIVEAKKGKSNYEEVVYNIKKRVDELIAKPESKAELGESNLLDVKRDIKSSIFIKKEQEILNEILKIAKDNGKKDLLLLMVCNGGDYKESEASDMLPTGPAFLEIERLYENMLYFKEFSLCDILPKLKLQEIKEAFPISITDKILTDVKEALVKYDTEIKAKKESIINGVFSKEIEKAEIKKDIKKLNEMKKDLKFSLWQRILHPFYYYQYVPGVKGFEEFNEFINNNIGQERDASFLEKLEKYLCKLDKQKYKEFKSLIKSAIDNEFNSVASYLLDQYSDIAKKKNDSTKISSLEKCMMDLEVALQNSVSTGDDEIFFKAVENIKKDHTYMWLFQSHREVFNKLEKLQHNPNSTKKEMSAFNVISGGNLTKKIAYVKDPEGDRAKAELVQKNIDDQVEKSVLRDEKNVAEAKAEKERKAKEEEKKGREEAEAKAEKAEAKADTYKSLLLQIKNGELPLSALDGIELDPVAGPSWKK